MKISLNSQPHIDAAPSTRGKVKGNLKKAEVILKKISAQALFTKPGQICSVMTVSLLSPDSLK